MRNCIVLSFDDNFFTYAKACLNSFQRNFPDHPLIKILYVGNDQKVIDFLSCLKNVERFGLEFDLEKFSGLNVDFGGSPMMYARFILWTKTFDEFDNVMYLDVDTIVLQPFPEILQSQDFFCVLDSNGEGVFLHEKRDSKSLVELLKQDDLNLSTVDSGMINSGMFVLPKKYRTKQQLDLLWALTNRYHSYAKFWDQSIISIWCQKNGISGSNEYKYNFQLHYALTELFSEIPQDSIKILHFAFWKPHGKLDNILLPAAKYILEASKSFRNFATMN